MKWALLGLALLPALFLIGAEPDRPPRQRTVPQLDVEKYLGKWYAVAGIPQFFNRSCVWGNSAEYSLREDGRIDVLNSCYKEGGEETDVRAVAWIPDGSEPGKLKVSFVPLLGYRLFPADYWVIELGDDYDYAVVGHPNRSFGWILSRKPEMEEKKLQAIGDRLEEMGYDFSEFERNRQTPPEE